VPTVNCSVTPNGGASIWVGIGGNGHKSGPLLQTGIDTNCVNGVQQNTAWFEEVPTTPDYSFSFDNFSISSGDSIQATVYQDTNGNWDTQVDDLTTGLSGWMVTGEAWGVGPDSGDTFTDQGTTTNLSYSGGYTAEWIVEDYKSDGVRSANVPFVDYGTVNFTNLETSLSSWFLTANETVELVQNDGTVLSTPSRPSNNAFSVSYTGSQSAAAT
jgi:hypothetical protein